MINNCKINLKRVVSLFMSVTVAASMFSTGGTAAFAEEDAAASMTEELNADNFNAVSNANAYKNYIAKYTNASKPMEEVVIDVTKFEASNGANCEVVDFEGETDCVSWLDCEGSVTWNFEVKTAGLYNLEMFYYPVAGKNTTIEYELMLDGEYPFDEAKLTELDRYWKNKTAIDFDARHKNQKRPPQVEYDCWVTYPIKDKDGLINTPYFFYLEAGKHTLTLNGVKTNI
ncbi:MAG: hypothetical protein KIG62_03675, partial [Oscillospiraceae bacterium]|nr:hypothetical protein [Oscillospiraceae bacterium]